MGYDVNLFFASVLLLVPMLAIAGGILALGRKFGWLPGGQTATAIFLLILFGAYTALYIGTSVSTLVVWPASLQRQYLGQQEAGLFALRHFEREGFMDPYYEWEYIVSDDVRARLAGNCKYVPKPPERHDCVLYSDSDDRWFAHISLWGNRLLMTDGLW